MGVRLPPSRPDRPMLIRGRAAVFLLVTILLSAVVLTMAVVDTMVRQAGIDMPFSANTPYVNTIPAGQEQHSPGQIEIEERPGDEVGHPAPLQMGVGRPLHLLVTDHRANPCTSPIECHLSAASRAAECDPHAESRTFASVLHGPTLQYTRGMAEALT